MRKNVQVSFFVAMSLVIAAEVGAQQTPVNDEPLPANGRLPNGAPMTRSARRIASRRN